MRLRVVLAMLLSLAPGCSEESVKRSGLAVGSAGMDGDNYQAFVAETKSEVSREIAPASAPAPADAPAPAPAPADGAPPARPPAKAARKIIFSGNVSVTVEDFGRAEQALTALVLAQGGYLAESNVSGSTGSHRSGTWKARIPVDRFDPFLDGVARLGELTSRHTGSEDVSDEFYDLEARIKNKTIEETRLIHHLEVSTGKLEEILQVERELARVRQEIERMQGRRQVLADLTAMTTVSVQFHEWKGYVPPESPRFTTRVLRSFLLSAQNLVAAGVWFLMALAAVVPWLPVIAVATLIVGWLGRRVQRSWTAR